MKPLSIILFCVLTIQAVAQLTEGPKTLFGNGNQHLGYFASPSCQFGEIARATTEMPGIGAGIVINNKFSGFNRK